MASQRHDAASRTAHIAEKQLQDACGANDLRAVALLRPADCVADGAGSLTARILRQHVGDLEEELLWRSADLLDNLGRVAGVVSFENLKDGSGILQGFVARAGVGPAGVVVAA